VSWEQRATEGYPRFEASLSLPSVPYARFAELIGLKGLYVDRPEFLAQAWTDALAADRPVVVEVKTDPNVPWSHKQKPVRLHDKSLTPDQWRW
jgi:pyruvate dehydrogenase (quinone)